MSDNLGKFFGSAALIAILAHGTYVLSGGEAYNGQHRDQFESALRQNVITNLRSNSDAKISFKAQEEFLNDFLVDNKFMKIDGLRGIYNSDGQKVPYKSLTNLMTNYVPLK